MRVVLPQELFFSLMYTLYVKVKYKNLYVKQRDTFVNKKTAFVAQYNLICLT